MEAPPLEADLHRACEIFREQADRSPELQAILRFFATVPCTKQRIRLFTGWNNSPNRPTKVINFNCVAFNMSTYGITNNHFHFDSEYASEHFLYEIVWYMEKVLPNQKPTVQELFWHQHGLLETNRTIFSYVHEETGLLARHCLVVLVNSNGKDVEENFNSACGYRDAIIDLGGVSSVLHAPDPRHKVFNIVIGSASRNWANYYIRLYSVDLFLDALHNKRFDPDLKCRFEIPQSCPPRLNIDNLSKLA